MTAIGPMLTDLTPDSAGAGAPFSRRAARGIEIEILLLLSNFSVRDDYRMNDPAGEAVPLAALNRRRAMKYICLGYLEPGKFEGMTKDERRRTLDECFEYNDHLRANG